VREPEGGAHRDHEAAAQLLDPVLERSLAELSNMPVRELLERRYERFRRMGQFMQLSVS
jgi:acetyl-CoA carboxylase carboxyl transferase subunit alpha